MMEDQVIVYLLLVVALGAVVLVVVLDVRGVLALIRQEIRY